MEMAEALKAVEMWPIDDRIEFVARVWDGIAASGAQPVVTVAQKAEIDRRIEELRKHPQIAVNWDSIVAHARRQR